MNRTFVIGVGMTKFEKPGSKDWDYPDMAKESGTKALEDAGVDYDAIEQAFVGYCYGESTSGQRAVYGLGLTGIPVVNVNNNCSTGSSALFMARQAVKGGLADCVLALGFEKMEKGSLGVKYTDRTNPMDKHAVAMFEVREPEASPPAPQMFGNAGREHMERYGSQPDHYAWIGWKNHKHSVNNPYAQFQDEYSLEEIKDAKMIHEPLTKLQCSPTSDGSGAVVVASERFVDEHDLWDQAVEIVGQAMVTDMAVHVRRRQLHQGRGLRHVQGGRGRPGLRGGAGLRRGRGRGGAARLLLRQRAHHLRGARPGRGGPRPRARRLRGHHLRRQVGRQPVGRADLQGPPARRHRPRAVLASSPGSCAARRTSARWRARRWASSTTSASAARRW